MSFWKKIYPTFNIWRRIHKEGNLIIEDSHAAGRQEYIFLISERLSDLSFSSVHERKRRRKVHLLPSSHLNYSNRSPNIGRINYNPEQTCERIKSTHPIEFIGCGALWDCLWPTPSPFFSFHKYLRRKARPVQNWKHAKGGANLLWNPLYVIFILVQWHVSFEARSNL